VLFAGDDDAGVAGLWETNGTAAGTHELTGISGTNPGGLFTYSPPIQPQFTAFNDEVLFAANDSSGILGLWVTNGTVVGTQELTGISGARASGLFSGGPTGSFVQPQFTVFNDEVLFAGTDISANVGLWVANGTAAGTQELTGISGAFDNGICCNTSLQFTVFNGEVLFAGTDVSGHTSLWVTNGTAVGTQELVGISGGQALFSNIQPHFTVFNGEVLFSGYDSITGWDNLWVTNGTATGTTELTGINGANTNGIFNNTQPYFAVLNGEVLFAGYDNDGIVGLWVTNGTAAGTHELTGIVGAVDGMGLNPRDLTLFNSEVLFDGNTQTGNALWETDGTSAGTHRLNPPGVSLTGLGPFDLTPSTISVPPPDDFTGSNTSDVLFRNNSTGDTWFEQMTTDDPFAGWHQIGGSDTDYSVVGTGDFFGIGADDILFRNNSTGDTWVEAISNGAFVGWDQIGGSDTHYSVVGVGDFFGNGTSGILFRNNSTGDTWLEAISDGAFAGWHQIGGSNTTYSVVGIGDYFGSNTSDILFRNASIGDTWFESITNGAFASWNHIGVSNTSYSVPITVGPPALT
jgi:hypothetical protein